MIWLLGILDLLAGILLLLSKFWVFKTLAFIFAGYLVLKGLIFFSFSGLVDIIVAILIILAVYGHFFMITYIAVLWLIQKGLFSLFV